MNLVKVKALKNASVMAIATCLFPSWAGAQATWPAAPVKLVVPFAAGGSNDNIARVVGTKLSARLGQTFVVDNRGGGGGTIGTDTVAKAAPDGYTLLFTSTSLTTNAASGKKLPFDPLKDLVPVGLIATSPFAVAVANNVKAKTLKEFIDLARAKPGSINYGSAGVGGMNHLATELFASAANVELTHVPYKGISQAFTDMMGGSLQLLLPSLAAGTQQIKAGKMRGLAVTGAHRSPLAPDIPTTEEAGLPGFRLEVWFGLMAPARTPPAVVKKLNDELNAVLAQPDVKEMLAREGAEPRPGTPEALGSLIRSDLSRWARLIKERNIQIAE
ncbi:tripartite tricarboxylate transporter substrate binding protein [Azohydromonas australica]|uniref:tripartite tricarboxylate transporter substrate binding protein n=1 Tax=Azohydromonas australica TaxID=364039 RepID=UPI0012EB5CA4|nr:tripartite tricarboxylate transporter substrate binding protein [Azohydromonas australica]